MTIDHSDELGERLIGLGLVASRYLLDLNRRLRVPSDFNLCHPWHLPSRLFQFPIEIGEWPDGTRRIGMMHPLLAAHPWVQFVEQKLGFAVDPGGAPNAQVVSSHGHGKWWHAVDLITARLGDELIATRQFTTDQDIARAVTYGLTYSAHDRAGINGYLTVAQARALLRAIDAPKPVDRAKALCGFAAPSACRSEKGLERWPINLVAGRDAMTEAWALVVGIENGWFQHDRAGFLGWTQAGRDRYAAGDSATYAAVSGQGTFAF